MRRRREEARRREQDKERRTCRAERTRAAATITGSIGKLSHHPGVTLNLHIDHLV